MAYCAEAAETAKAHGFTTNSFGERIALMHSELSEALEEWRKPGAPGEHDFYYVDIRKPEGIYPELADVLIRIFDFAGQEGKGELLADALEAKLAYNKTRPWKHGKRF